MDKKFIQWLPLIIAFTAGIFAISRIRSNNITNARIKWLENFKNLISDFFAESAILQLMSGIEKGIDKKKGKFTST